MISSISHLESLRDAVHGPSARPNLEVEALHELPESPQGFGVRWLAGNGADTALEFMAWAQAKAVCAPGAQHLCRFTDRVPSDVEAA